MGVANTSVYAATKNALLTGPHLIYGIIAAVRVNAISPGPVTTGSEKTGLSWNKVNGFKEALTNQIPIGRLGDMRNCQSSYLLCL